MQRTVNERSEPQFRRYQHAAALTVDVEDWFHSYNVKPAITTQDWDGCASFVVRNTERMLEIMEANSTHGTFFVLGWVAEKYPGLVRLIAEAGHEVASHGYNHEPVYAMTETAFRADVARSKAVLEDITGSPVHGYRAPCFSITNWALPILRDTGFIYDSSYVPTLAHDRYGSLDDLDAGDPIAIHQSGMIEASLSCLNAGGRGIPWGGGGYFRIIPYPIWVKGVRAILRSGHPYIFYIHPWEIESAQPEVPGIGALNRFRQRVNVHACEHRFSKLLKTFDWMRLIDLIASCVPGASGRLHRLSNVRLGYSDAFGISS